MNRLKKLLIGSLAFIIIIIILNILASRSTQNSSKMTNNISQNAVEVSTLIIRKQKVDITHTLPARVTAYKQSQVRPQIDGIITKRYFEEGATVKQGDQLYQIDDTRYMAIYNRSLADLKSAKANVQAIEAKKQRYENLVKEEAVSKQEYDDAIAQLAQAYAAIEVAQSTVDLAKVDLDYTKVYAPIAGKIGKSFVTEGALVTANQQQSLAIITQLDPVYIDIQQSGVESILIRSHLDSIDNIPVRVTMGKESDEVNRNKGVLKFSGVTVDETSGSINLRAVVSNPKQELLPGLFVNALLDLGTFNLILVPQRAAIRQPDGTLAIWFIDKDKKAEKRAIDAKYTYKNNWIIENNIKEGEEIVIEGYQKLQPNMMVKTVEWDRPVNKSSNRKAKDI